MNTKPTAIGAISYAPIAKKNTEKESVRQTFSVLNLHCAGCAGNVERALKTQDGVVEVSVSYANTQANISYLPTKTNPDKLRKVVQALGYDLLLTTSTNAVEELEEAQAKSHTSLKRRSIVAFIFAIPLFIIGMFFHTMPNAALIMWGLATPILFYSAWPFFVSAYKQAKRLDTNMDTLVALSTGIAYLFSVFNTLFPQFLLSRGLEPHVYFEASGVVVAFILLGKLIEERSKAYIASAVKKLMKLQPTTATVVKPDGSLAELPIAQIQKGAILLVKPGEQVAVDGKLVEGTSFVDESMINGEPIPAEKQPGSSVFAGTINQKGSFRFMATEVGSNTILANIIRTVQDAQASKVPIQQLADKLVRIFVPVVMSIAIIAFILWLTIGGTNSLTHGLLALVTVLIVACPCALGLATPTAIMVGVGKGASLGILVKNAEALQQAKDIGMVVFDKTGTITEGKPTVTDIAWLNNDSSTANILASIEKQSEHPLADAIVKYLATSGSMTISGFKSRTGLGAEGKVDSNAYYVGKQTLLDKNGISIADTLIEKAKLWLGEAKTLVWFANGREALAVVAISDRVKPTSIEAIKQLHGYGIETCLLTGDNAEVAAAVAKETGIDSYEANLLPSEKAAQIKQLQANGTVVAMVGDGINDSGALAQADVGIAMGSGSGIAMDVAKLTIVSNDLNRVVDAIRLSKQTVSAIRYNLFWAFIYNIVAIPLAAGLLYPFTGFLLNPMIAGFAMAMSSVSLMLNSIYIKLKPLPKLKKIKHIAHA